MSIESIPQGQLIGEALRIVEKGESRNIHLRLMGALAVYVHCSEEAKALHGALKRQFTDMDFITTNDRKGVKKLFVELGYSPRERFMAMMGEVRHIYENPNTGTHADVFFDELDMCHKIDFRSRILLDCPTISLADLLLEKLQIVEMNEKDIKDVVVLTSDHQLGASDEKETINVGYISEILGRDWGFYYTVTSNLVKIKDTFLRSYEQTLSQSNQDQIRGRISKMLEEIDNAPKSLNWKMRAKVGTKKKWYNDVEELSQ